MDDEQGSLVAASPSSSPNKTLIRQHVKDLINNLSRLVIDCCTTIQEFINTKKNKSLFLSDTNMPLPRTVSYHLTQEPLLLLSATIWRHALDHLHAVEKQLYVSTSPQGYHDDYFIGLGDNFKVSPGDIRDTEIVERIYFLERARIFLLEFLSKLYTVVEGFEHPIVSSYQESALFLSNINRLFLELEASMGTISTIGSLSFKELPFQNDVDVSHLSPSDRIDTVRLIYSNLHKLDNYLSSVVTKCHEPMKQGRRWMHYTFGAIGISVLSVWLLRHSRLSVTIDNRVLEAKRSISWFLSDHVVQPLTAIRGGLVNTLRDRHKRVMEQEQEQEQEQQLTSDLLRRMSLDFGERRGKKFPPNVPDQELLDMVTGSYEEQLRHPIKNLIMGDLGYAMLIDFLKLKLDIEGVMPALINQLDRVEQSSFIILTVTAILLYLGVRKRSHASAKARACLKEDIRKKEIKRIAKYERELLLEAKKYFMQQKEKNTLWSQEHHHYINGLLLSTLDRLYRSVEKYGKESFSWACLQDDFITLGMPNARTWLKHEVIAEWKERQDWLLPLAVP